MKLVQLFLKIFKCLAGWRIWHNPNLQLAFVAHIAPPYSTVRQ